MIQHVRNPTFHAQTKHIEVQHHYIYEHIVVGHIDLQYIGMDLQTTNRNTTRALGTNKLWRFSTTYVLHMPSWEGRDEKTRKMWKEILWYNLKFWSWRLHDKRNKHTIEDSLKGCLQILSLILCSMWKVLGSCKLTELRYVDKCQLFCLPRN